MNPAVMTVVLLGEPSMQGYPVLTAPVVSVAEHEIATLTGETELHRVYHVDAERARSHRWPGPPFELPASADLDADLDGDGDVDLADFDRLVDALGGGSPAMVARVVGAWREPGEGGESEEALER